MFLVYTHAFTTNMYKFVFLFVFSVTYMLVATDDAI